MNAPEDGQRTALYRLYDADERLLYVGIATEPRARWAQHALEKIWWTSVSIREIEWFDTRQEAASAEIIAIQAESPVHNRQHNPVGRAARMAEMTTYRAIARPVGNWWALEVPELPGVFSQASRLDKAEREIVEAISLMLGVEPEHVGIRIDAELPDEARLAMEEVHQTRRAREDADTQLRQANRRVAEVLTKDLDLSQRDAGYILGISFQRVSQVLNDSE